MLLCCLEYSFPHSQSRCLAFSGGVFQASHPIPTPWPPWINLLLYLSQAFITQVAGRQDLMMPSHSLLEVEAPWAVRSFMETRRQPCQET